GENRGFAPRGDLPLRAPHADNPHAMNLAPRRVALETQLDVSRSDAYASLALDKRLAAALFGRRDRAFTTQLVYGTLENRIALDWRIDQFLEGEKEIEPAVREILRMGAYQLFYLDRVPDMAAVDESVSLTRAMGFEGFTGLVNAVLRNMIRGKENVVWPKPADDPAKYLSVMFSAPMDLAQLLIEAYGENGALNILRHRPKDRDITVRVNYLRCDDARLRSLFADEELEFSPGIVPGTYKVRHAGDMTRMRAFQNGLFTIQGESSVIAARMVGAKPGQTVLDACAAPGGKTAVLSEMMNDTGRVYAWDTHAHRVELIRGTANRLKLENVRPAVKDASAPRPDMAMTLDAALIDAPCSGTGVMLEKPDLKYRVTREGVASLCRTQAEILDAIAPMLRVGGTLVYSTCSVLPQENGAQVRAFLERHPEYEVVPMAAELPQALAQYETEFGLQMFAHRDGTDGFYVCRMRRVRA
ncbi:MAG: 16S rRNA (cytosine(967)-C(5))-methyltransferase RsmB, partial [Clostridia bacterium]|nr:16S rRNA (cytosine(967)-C(5))-methyltransferase RsmB [Clostridia bacterium]